MKDPTDAKEKTSRRSFAKTVATALVAVPVVSSLSSCAQQSGTPSPTPSPERLRKYLERGANPPVLIDGGSFEIAVPATLIKQADDPVPANPPRPTKKYDHKFTQPNRLGPIKGIQIIDDYTYDLLPAYPLATNETLAVEIWIDRVDVDGEDIENGTGEVKYKEALAVLPDIVIQGGNFQGGNIAIRSDKDISNNERKLYKGKKKNKKRYHINDWGTGTKPFRIAKVLVFVSTQTGAKYTSSEADLENGLRIIIGFA